MIGAVARAELFHLRRRPAPWILGAVWLLQILVFAYFVPFLVYRGQVGNSGSDSESMLQPLLPASLAFYNVALYPLFGVAVVLILGALVAGGDYRWGTIAALLTQRPNRTTVLSGKLVSFATALLVLVAAAFALCAACSAVVAKVEHRPLAWPSPLAMLSSFGAAWLGVLVFGLVGFTLAVLFRGVATALAIGLLWTLAIESAINGIATVFSQVAIVQYILIGPNVGSLAVALGATTQFQGGTPGVVQTAHPAVAVAVLCGYLAVAVAASLTAFRRRDA